MESVYNSRALNPYSTVGPGLRYAVIATRHLCDNVRREHPPRASHLQLRSDGVDERDLLGAERIPEDRQVRNPWAGEVILDDVVVQGVRALRFQDRRTDNSLAL